MKINLFSIPIFIGNIDAEKITLENETFKKTIKGYCRREAHLTSKTALNIYKPVSLHWRRSSYP